MAGRQGRGRGWARASWVAKQRQVQFRANSSRPWRRHKTPRQGHELFALAWCRQPTQRCQHRVGCLEGPHASLEALVQHCRRQARRRHAQRGQQGSRKQRVCDSGRRRERARRALGQPRVSPRLAGAALPRIPAPVAGEEYPQQRAGVSLHGLALRLHREPQPGNHRLCRGYRQRAQQRAAQQPCVGVPQRLGPVPPAAAVGSREGRRW